MDFAGAEKNLSFIITLLKQIQSDLSGFLIEINAVSAALNNENKMLIESQVTLNNHKKDFNDIIIDSIPNFIKGLGLSNKALADTVTAIGGLTFGLNVVLSIVNNFKNIFPGVATMIVESMGEASLYILGVVELIFTVIEGIKEWKRIESGNHIYKDVSVIKPGLITNNTIGVQSSPFGLPTEYDSQKATHTGHTDPVNETKSGYLPNYSSGEFQSFETAKDSIAELVKYESNRIDLAKLLKNGYEEQLQTSLENLKTADNENLSDEQRINLLQEVHSITNEINQIEEKERAEDEAGWHAKKQRADDEKQKQREFYESIKVLDDEVNKNRINLIEDEFQKRKAEIDQVYKDEHEKIIKQESEARDKNLKLFGTDKLKESQKSAFDSLLKQNDEKKQAALIKLEQDALAKAFSGIKGSVSGISNIMNILQVGADTFVGKLLSGFSATLSIVDSIVAVINSINQASSGIGILGDIFGGLLSIIPGGGAVKALAGAAGGMPHYSGSSGMPNINSLRSMSPGRSYNPNISVMVHSEIGRQASYKVLVDGRIYESKKADR